MNKKKTLSETRASLYLFCESSDNPLKKAGLVSIIDIASGITLFVLIPRYVVVLIPRYVAELELIIFTRYLRCLPIKSQ